MENNNIPPGKTEAFSTEKYEEYFSLRRKLSENEKNRLGKAYLRSEAHDMTSFCYEQAMLEGSDGGE